MRCPSCQRECPSDARFCMQCGTAISVEPRSLAERRQLTVMFCDLVGSTTLSRRLDPEEFRDLLGSYQSAACEVIQSHGGFVAQYLGDGILVYFGYPLAHEDDAQRSARAALAIVAAMEALNVELSRRGAVRLEIRIGIHTGLVVVGSVGIEGRSEKLALGETPNVAARLQALASPGQILISSATCRLLGGAFVTGAPEQQAIKGIDEPVVVHRLGGESGEEHGAGSMRTRLTEVVGRGKEERLLRDRWQEVLEGHGQIVSIAGGAGIGKSRLVAVARKIAAENAHGRLEAHGSEQLQNTALQPVVELMQRLLRIRRGDPHEKTLEKLERSVEALPLERDEAVPLLGEFLSVPVPPDRYPPLALTAARKKERTLAAIAAIFGEAAARRPTLFVLEDLHWVDPSTLELLDVLMQTAATRTLMIVLSHRPSFSPGWEQRENTSTILLGRLGEQDVRKMIDGATGGRSLPAEVVNQIIARTDGVPLFVEELTRTILESGLLEETDAGYRLHGALPALEIPATLHDSLMARLDRLGSARGVAQLGAAIGRRFPFGLLRAVWPHDLSGLQRALGILEEADLLHHEPGGTEPVYVFKHALVRDAAYESLLRSTQREYHERIANALHTGFPELEKTQPELLAHHLVASDQPELAVPYWQRAGQRALERSANPEARAHFTRGLECLEAMSEGNERKLIEAALRTSLAVSLQATHGMGAPELGPLYERARVLCEELGDVPQLFPVLRGMFLFYGIRGEVGIANRLAGQLLALVENAQDPGLLLEARRTMCFALWAGGELEAALGHGEQALAIYDPDVHGAHAYRFGGTDPGLACWVWRGLILSWLGRTSEAEQSMARSVELADAIGHPLSQCTALQWAGAHYQFRDEVGRTLELTERCLAIASEQGIPVNVAMARMQRGWALARGGQAEEGLAEIHAGLDLYRATGALFAVPYFLGQLADACAHTGRVKEGLAAVTEALERAEKTGEHCWKAELHRLRGDLLLAQEPPDENSAEHAFELALEAARAQAALAVELRASIRLASCWHRRGRADDARRQLSEVLAEFKDGRDVAEVAQARSLLGSWGDGAGSRT